MKTKEEGVSVMQSKEGQKEKIKVFHSISAAICGLVLLIILLTMIGLLACMLPRTERISSDTNGKYLLSLVEMSADSLDSLAQESDNEEDADANFLKSVKIEQTPSAYLYLVAADGTILYHPVADNIGKQIEVDMVSNVVKELQAGRVPENAVIHYEYKGTAKYAAFALTADHRIVVLCADQDEILGAYNSLYFALARVALISLLFCMCIGFLISRRICKPIRALTNVITQTANLDFRSNPKARGLLKKKDETGIMARAIHNMRNNLRDMVNHIEDINSQIVNNMDHLKEVTSDVDSMCSDNSATTQELAAGMEETSASTEMINGHVDSIKTGADEIVKLAEDGDSVSGEVMKRAQTLQEKTLTASEKTQKMYQNVKEKSDRAIEESQAVDKINELTGTIMSISSQTSLLALNASIEAARAGEAGKGFAVVATEIGSLAGQTSQAVTDINDIVREVNVAVANMSECLTEIIDFLEETVLPEYNEFKDVSVQYHQDANVFKDSMTSVKGAIDSLGQAVDKIVGAIRGINQTIHESTVGVNDIAEKTTEIVGKSADSFDAVKECQDSVGLLHEMMERFTMQ